jgi:hypothetical protein
VAEKAISAEAIESNAKRGSNWAQSTKLGSAPRTDCQTKIKNPADFLNYKALPQNRSGHTGMMIFEEQKG